MWLDAVITLQRDGKKITSTALRDTLEARVTK